MEKEDIKNSPWLVDFDDELTSDIIELIRSKSGILLLNILNDLYTADIAHIINRLEIADADYVFNLLTSEDSSKVIVELREDYREHFLETLSQKKLSDLVNEMPSDNAAGIMRELSDERASFVLEEMSETSSEDVQELLQYKEGTAGGIMQKEVVTVLINETIKKAIQAVRKASKTIENIQDVYILNENNQLVGSISVSSLILISPNRKIRKVMESDILSVLPNVDQEEVARIFEKYDIVSLPVVDNEKNLLGKIAIDDIVDVFEQEHAEDVAHLVGSDADELESKSPTQIALLRLPWVLLTLFIELFAGVVISHFNETLSQVILLAAFMPIISAISGNTGLQSAAIMVRGIATGKVDIKKWWEPFSRQIKTTLIIGFVCGSVIGTVASLWNNNFIFGFVVGISMFISINISGVVGTSMPIISKRLGFDPAITSGPFETAFQDVVGITIFLSIATLLINSL
ncbi:MAG: magnesium transporter [Bacteroidetes bacterium]|nr:magnesium transporter [Bacteroidota bacterium]